MRLIDADRFLGQLEDQYMEHDLTRKEYIELEDRIMQQPTVEIPKLKGYEVGHTVRGELVRCKDCKKSSKCYRHTIIQSSTGSGEIHCPLEYCSEGERRE